MDAHAQVARMPPRGAAARRPAGGWRDGDTRPGENSGSSVLDIARLPEIDGPQIGQWYLLAREEAAQPSRLRLCWMSPLRTRAVLAHHDGFHQLALEAHEMLSMLHAGTLRHMEASRLMQTALAI